MAISSRRKPPVLYVIDEEFVLPDRGDDQEGPEAAIPAGDPDEAPLSVTCARPVELAPLRSALNLWALDISAAPVTDIATVTELDGLRFLEVTQDQWRKLSELGDLPSLAVVGIHPHRPERNGGTSWLTAFDEPPSPTP
ncbi:hypothetical protein [Spirillospora sp. CA-128828]|uniref:hypothetical protein n=1 Tax=Spirillospora sp. CA-128828 TaxID=3240033 RepID=UPI003D8B8D40